MKVLKCVKNAYVFKDINVFIHVYEICMHMLKYYESFKMCKECICVLMIKLRI